MKRIIILTLALIIAAVPALADIDLSGLSFDELRELQARISQELTTRPEWKSVPVPPGIYRVGVEIPAGMWTITAGDSSSNFISVECGARTNETGTSIRAGQGWQFRETICQPGTGEGKHPESITVTLTDGLYVTVEHGQAIFSTPEAIDLGF